MTAAILYYIDILDLYWRSATLPRGSNNVFGIRLRLVILFRALCKYKYTNGEEGYRRSGRLVARPSDHEGIVNMDAWALRRRQNRLNRCYPEPHAHYHSRSGTFTRSFAVDCLLPFCEITQEPTKLLKRTTTMPATEKGERGNHLPLRSDHRSGTSQVSQSGDNGTGMES